MDVHTLRNTSGTSGSDEAEASERGSIAMGRAASIMGDAMLILGIAVNLRREISNGRLDEGVDPPWGGQLR